MIRRNPTSKAALILPALNEESSLGAALGRVPPHLFRDVIVADNGSTDNTAEVARSYGATVIHVPERGYGAACLEALAGLPEGPEAVVFMQADASEDAAEAERLLEPILAGEADLVLGSRTLGEAEPGSLEPHQRLGNRLVTFLVRHLYGARYTDLGPFRAIRLSALERLGMRDRDYGWTIEMQIRALQLGLRVIEVPVSYRRRVGVSKVSGNWRASLEAGIKILWTVFRLSLSRPPATNTPAN
jgi:glycosyltransferase involved in cell wall biosynthesis